MIDYRVIEESNGSYDVVIPLEKVKTPSKLLQQQINLILDTWAGEFLYDITAGIPYNEIIGQNIDATRIEAIYFDIISKLQFFKKMDNFEISIDKNRVLMISFDVTSIDGVTNSYRQVS